MAQKSQILDKYLTALERDPKSRVFAPLAEYYRKSGLLTQAIETLNQGIKHNPSYVLGYLGLAFCYFENGNSKRSYEILRPLIESNRDNLRMLRLYSDVCLDLNKSDEALETLKYLLFINPKDTEAAAYVKKLEAENKKFGPIKFNLHDVLNDNNDNSADEESIQFNVDDLDTSLQSEKKIDEWSQLDLANEQKVDTDLNAWSMNDRPRLQDENIDTIEPEAERSFEVKVDKVEGIKATSPVITHTLVDLYCNQGYLDKAKDLLEKILELNPNDLKTKLKLQEVVRVIDDSFIDEEDTSKESKNEVEQHVSNSSDDVDESTGRDNLMSLFDKKINAERLSEIGDAETAQSEKAKELRLLKSKEIQEVEKKLWTFHEGLVAKAKSVLSV